MQIDLISEFKPLSDIRLFNLNFKISVAAPWLVVRTHVAPCMCTYMLRTDNIETCLRWVADRIFLVLHRACIVRRELDWDRNRCNETEETSTRCASTTHSQVTCSVYMDISCVWYLMKNEWYLNTSVLTERRGCNDAWNMSCRYSSPNWFVRECDTGLMQVLRVYVVRCFSDIWLPSHCVRLASCVLHMGTCNWCNYGM